MPPKKDKSKAVVPTSSGVTRGRGRRRRDERQPQDLKVALNQMLGGMNGMIENLTNISELQTSIDAETRAIQQECGGKFPRTPAEKARVQVRLDQLSALNDRMLRVVEQFRGISDRELSRATRTNRALAALDTSREAKALPAPEGAANMLQGLDQTRLLKMCTIYQSIHGQTDIQTFLQIFTSKLSQFTPALMKYFADVMSRSFDRQLQVLNQITFKGDEKVVAIKRSLLLQAQCTIQLKKTLALESINTLSQSNLLSSLENVAEIIQQRNQHNVLRKFHGLMSFLTMEDPLVALFMNSMKLRFETFKSQAVDVSAAVAEIFPTLTVGSPQSNTLVGIVQKTRADVLAIGDSYFTFEQLVADQARDYGFTDEMIADWRKEIQQGFVTALRSFDLAQETPSVRWDIAQTFTSLEKELRDPDFQWDTDVFKRAQQRTTLVKDEPLRSAAESETLSKGFDLYLVELKKEKAEKDKTQMELLRTAMVYASASRESKTVNEAEAAARKAKQNAFIAACKTDDLSVVEELLVERYEFNHKDLYLAVMHGPAESGAQKIVHKLCELKFDQRINRKIGTTSKNGQWILQLAAERSHLAVVKMLLAQPQMQRGLLAYGNELLEKIKDKASAAIQVEIGSALAQQHRQKVEPVFASGGVAGEEKNVSGFSTAETGPDVETPEEYFNRVSGSTLIGDVEGLITRIDVIRQPLLVREGLEESEQKLLSQYDEASQRCQGERLEAQGYATEFSSMNVIARNTVDGARLVKRHKGCYADLETLKTSFQDRYLPEIQAIRNRLAALEPSSPAAPPVLPPSVVPVPPKDKTPSTKSNPTLEVVDMSQIPGEVTPLVTVSMARAIIANTNLYMQPPKGVDAEQAMSIALRAFTGYQIEAKEDQMVTQRTQKRAQIDAILQVVLRYLESRRNFELAETGVTAASIKSVLSSPRRWYGDKLDDAALTALHEAVLQFGRVMITGADAVSFDALLQDAFGKRLIGLSKEEAAPITKLEQLRFRLANACEVFLLSKYERDPDRTMSDDMIRAAREYNAVKVGEYAIEGVVLPQNVMGGLVASASMTR